MKTSITAIENTGWNTPLVLRGGFEKSIHMAADIGYDGAVALESFPYPDILTASSKSLT